jgi:glucokinase
VDLQDRLDCITIPVQRSRTILKKHPAFSIVRETIRYRREFMNLVADIGATNARFQLCSGSVLQTAPVMLATAEFENAANLLSVALNELPEFEPQRALLAIAGPAAKPGQIQVTNTGLRFDALECAAVLGCETHLANDFYALAHAVPHFQELTQVGGGETVHACKALLGPGSGLGMATIIPVEAAAPVEAVAGSTRWQVLGSEGGHADLAPGSHLEAELWGILIAEHGHVSWETVLCGGGIQQLYQAMSVLWGSKPEDISPAEISTRGIAIADPVCHQTMETFCALLGAVAGNFALTVAAQGGVYIGGGIVPQMLDFVVTSPLRRRFEERGAMSSYVKEIPLFVITEENPGLQGAAHCLNAQTVSSAS